MWIIRSVVYTDILTISILLYISTTTIVFYQGQRLLARWIKQPLIDVNHLEERLDAVQAFVEGAELRQSLISEHLKKLPDFDKYVITKKRLLWIFHFF